MKLKLVAFDNSILLIALRKGHVLASVDNAKARVDYLVSELSKAGERILIPTPALSETLVHAEKAANVYLEELQKSSRFQIAPFDTKAAVEVAADIATSIKKGDKKGGSATWAKANFDRQIAAIAKSAGAHTVYTDDEDVEKHAKRMGLQVIRLRDLLLPESKTPLLDLIDEHEKKSGSAKDEGSQSEPTQVPRSSERTAESKPLNTSNPSQMQKPKPPKP